MLQTTISLKNGQSDPEEVIRLRNPLHKKISAAKIEGAKVL
jgi:hypothetical protein